ncbi:MAG TPA: hypothetical protein DEF79_11335 [Gammaproteobacteria bacterium]|nr:hypothetical protein [Gammaproteobacteria bacterium]
MKYDIRRLTLTADTLLETTTNLRHRQILNNYRRHAMLEVSGRYKEIFTPEMTVEHPFYRITSADGVLELDGIEAVQGFYQSLIDNHSTVMLLEHENIIVNDWGFASEALFRSFIPAETAMANGHDVPDMNANYIESRWVCMMWPYDEAGRMIGERVYQAPTASLEKCTEEDFLTLDHVRSVFDPILMQQC